MVRIGLAGRGFMGGGHLMTYAGMKSAKVVSICDKRKEALTPHFRTSGNISTDGASVDFEKMRWHTRFEDMLTDPEIDVVDICLPTHLHAEAAIAAFRAGKHVICEKPLARNSKDAARMVAEAEKRDKRLFVGHCIRYWPAYARAREIIRSGKYGKVLSARFVRLSTTPTWTADNWILEAKNSGAAAMDLHIHDSDFILYTFGAPAAVVSRGGRLNNKREPLDHFSTFYEYPDGKLVTAEGSWIYAPGFAFRMQFAVAMEKASMELGADGKLMLHTMKGKSSEVKLPAESGYELELRDFLLCIARNRASKVVTPQSAVESVKLVEAEMKSAISGKRVALGR